MCKVSMEVAIAAHSKDMYFKQPCICGDADEDGNCSRCEVLQKKCEEDFSPYLPMQHEVQSELRKFGIHASSEAMPYGDKVVFQGHVLFVSENVMVSESAKEIRSNYEDGLNDGLLYALDMIEISNDGEYDFEDEEDDDNDEDYE